MSEPYIDPARLENVKQLEGGAIRAACPACRAAGSDKSGNHLLIKSDGKFGCAANPKDEQHRKEIFKLAGQKSQPKPARSAPKSSARKIVATYDYRDSFGTLLFQVVRYSNKDFFQRKPDGNGGWNWKVNGVERVLFRLPELLSEIEDGRPIYVCEGEKDVLAMVKNGFAATCNPGGAGKWADGYSDALRGADVFIIADKDKAGRDHARLVAGKIRNVAASVRVIELPDTNGKTVKDAADFFAAGGQAVELDELAQSSVNAPQPVLENSEDEQPDDGIKFISAAKFKAIEIVKPAEIIHGILHTGSKMSIGGASKSFKTWSLLDIAISISTGSDWLQFHTTQSKVLFMNFEIQDFSWQTRLNKVADAKNVELNENLILCNMRGLAEDFRTLIPKLIRRCESEQFSVIILDPIYKIYGNTDENSARDTAALLNALEELATTTGAGIIFAAHFAKGNAAGKNAIDRISGSGVFARDPDSILVFTEHEQESAFTIEPILRNFQTVPAFPVRWKFPLMEMATDLDPSKLKQAAGRKKEYDPAKLLAFIAENDESNPISVSDWAKAAYVKRPTLINYLSEIRNRNFIKTVGSGTSSRVVITNEGKAFLNSSRLSEMNS